MKNIIFIILGLSASFIFGFKFQKSTNKSINKQSKKILTKNDNMKLGAFSVSLNVKNLNESKLFYEKLGFKVFAGDFERKYLIMKNENALIGLFQGMFEENILTFNPGWDENAHNIKKFDDVRIIQKKLKIQNTKLISEADENTSGPASLMLNDPDGNTILIDQHR
jgi:catechol 2,3-dioxygenase-like lactoylglutathione lyase family enzyme